MLDIAMLLLNPFTHDSRVDKEAASLAAAGHRVTVYALWDSGLPIEEDRNGYHISRLQLPSRALKGGTLAPLLKYAEFTLLLLGKIRGKPHQVYHANDALTLPAAWIASRRGQAFLVYDAHELETGRNFGGSRLSGIYQRLWAWPERTFIRKADAVITVNDSIAEELHKLYGIPLPVVVMNTPTTQVIQPSDRLRQEMGIPPEQKIVLYQGVIHTGRGIEELFDAVQRLPGVAAVALGNGPRLEEMRARIHPGGWQRVYLPGRVALQDLLQYTASADLGVLLSQPICRSYYLSLPNKLFEYLHAGLPVLGSDLPEFRRVILEHQVGRVIDPYTSSESIAAAIEAIFADPAGYQAYRENAHKTAQLYCWEKEAEKLLGCYRELERKWDKHS